MKIILYLFILLPFLLTGQDEIDPKIIVDNGIRIIEGYSVFLEDETQSTLKTRETFNTKGRRTLIEVFNDNGSISEYAYEYESDTIRIKRVTTFDGKPFSYTLLHYDNKGRKIKTVGYYPNGQRNGSNSITKYKRKGRKVENIYYSNYHLVSHEKIKYDKEGNLLSAHHKIGNKWVKQLKPKSQTETILNYNDSNLDLKTSTTIINKDQSIIGLIGPVKLSEGDILQTDTYLNQDKLTEHATQTLDSKVIGKIRYKYFR